MKKITLIIALTISALTFKAQQPSIAGQTWQNAILRADALTEIDGVESYCLHTTCNNEDVVLIKFINKNNYKVRVEWVDAIKVDGQWVYPKNQTPKVLYLDPNNTVVGDCNGLDKLKVKVSSIINNPKDFKHYTVSGLVTKQ
jgi:hypothetical protein